jgi:integrase
MPVYRDKKAGRFIFEFDRLIRGQRVRARKQLPKTWNQSQADAFDRQESARLYALVVGIEKQSYTIEDAVSVYLKERVPQLKHGLDYAHALALMFPFYQARPIEALADVCKAYQLRAVKEDGSKLAPATIKNRIRYLTAACRYGWKQHDMGEVDPAARVTVPQVRNERQKYITRSEFLKLCRACDHQETRALMRIAFYSGMRLSEILRAYVVGGNFVLETTKNEDPRLIPISPKIKTCLKESWSSQFTLNYHFVKAREAVGMPWLHFHDLRHSSASAMLQSGVDLHTVGAVLGHRSAQSTRRYAHLATDNLKVAIGQIGKRVA